MLTARPKHAKDDQPILIGWREKVSLPQLGVGTFSAKIDTGARSAALHATDIEQDDHHVTFVLPLKGRHHHCRLPLKGMRKVKSSSGHTETRAVVETDVKIGKLILSHRSHADRPHRHGRSHAAGPRQPRRAASSCIPTKTNILSARKRKTAHEDRAAHPQPQALFAPAPDRDGGEARARDGAHRLSQMLHEHHVARSRSCAIWARSSRASTR